MHDGSTTSDGQSGAILATGMDATTVSARRDTATAAAFEEYTVTA
jgi:hypothetical protein